MKKNIFFETMVLINKNEIHPIENAKYDEKRGLWIWEKTNDVLVKTRDESCPIMCTKKFDQETGEDKKGE